MIRGKNIATRLKKLEEQLKDPDDNVIIIIDYSGKELSEDETHRDIGGYRLVIRPYVKDEAVDIDTA